MSTYTDVVAVKDKTAFDYVADPIARAAAKPRTGIKRALSIIAWFNFISALAGMAGLTIGRGMGIPLEWLEGSPFRSYFWPGIILGVIVGGTQLLPILARHRGYQLTWGLHAAAGLVMMIWIFVEISMMLVWSPLHGIYFFTGLLQTVLAVLALGAWPTPFWQQERQTYQPSTGLPLTATQMEIA